MAMNPTSFAATGGLPSETITTRIRVFNFPFFHLDHVSDR